MKQNIEGFLSSPFFAATNPEERKSVEFILQQTKAHTGIDDCDYLYQQYLYRYSFNEGYTYEELGLIVKIVAVDYFVTFDYLKYIVNDDEIEKVMNVINRKQYNSKLFLNVASKIGFLISRTNTEAEFAKLFQIEIKKLIDQFIKDKTLKEFEPLIEVVNKATSGVKSICYLKSVNFKYGNYLEKDINDYINEKYKYNFNNHEYLYFYGNLKEHEESQLQKILLNDSEIWDKISLFSLLNHILEHNDLKHATKLIDYIFDKACKMKEYSYLIHNHFPLIFANGFTDRMLSKSSEWIQSRLSNVLDSEFSDEEIMGLIYPINSNDEIYNCIQKGKELFDNIIKKAYPTEHDKFIEIINNKDNIIQEKEVKSKRGVQKREVNISLLLDADIFGYLDEVEKKYAYSYFNDFGTSENLLNRLYYQIYLISIHSKDELSSIVYEYYYDLFNMIDIKYDLHCSFTFDLSERDKKYNMLKDILKKYGFNIDDKFKQNYIIALLDRKHALIDEKEQFARFEQYGDAIYELAIDNILFYDQEQHLKHENREQYVSANGQIEVAKCIGTNKCYISKLNDAMNKKYDNYERNEEGLDWHEGHYISDSLEMIIGALAVEFGLIKALDFSTKIILKTYDDLKEPSIIDLKSAIMQNHEIDREHLKKIFPNPFYRDDDSDYFMEYTSLWEALNKIIKINVIGNETKEKRRMITNNFDSKIYGEDSKWDYYYDYVVAYLYEGIEATIEKARPVILKNYKI